MSAVHWPGTKPPHTLPDTPDVIEARARRLMAFIARLPRRGWDDDRTYVAEVQRLDGMLDAWNEATR